MGQFLLQLIFRKEKSYPKFGNVPDENKSKTILFNQSKSQI